ncbi:MAG: hypothetical protein R3F37_11955 [Candidatus Competibacteraceae bacterium]
MLGMLRLGVVAAVLIAAALSGVFVGRCRLGVGFAALSMGVA